MTQNADHIEGFHELLEADGRKLLYGTLEFRALIRAANPAEDRFDLSPTDNDAVEISALRDQVPELALRVGAHLQDLQGTRYRVTRLRRSPHRAIVKLESVVLHP